MWIPIIVEFKRSEAKPVCIQTHATCKNTHFHSVYTSISSHLLWCRLSGQNILTFNLWCLFILVLSDPSLLPSMVQFSTVFPLHRWQPLSLYPLRPICYLYSWLLDILSLTHRQTLTCRAAFVPWGVTVNHPSGSQVNLPGCQMCHIGVLPGVKSPHYGPKAKPRKWTKVPPFIISSPSWPSNLLVLSLHLNASIPHTGL